MLKDLKVLNGNLDLKFDEYIYIYTVSVDSNVTSLDLEYKLADNCFAEIRNNQLDNDESIVYLDIYNGNDLEVTYTLYVYKENVNYSSGIEDYKKTLLIETNHEVDLHKIELLSVGIFITIILIFSIIFRKKKIRN